MPRLAIRNNLLSVAVVVIGSTTCHMYADTAAVWDRSSNNWSSAADWSANPNYPNNGIPSGVLYDVTVNGGAITLDVNPTIQLFNFSNGALQGADSLTVDGLFDWSGGQIGNTVLANGGIDFDGGGSDFINGGTLTNAPGANATLGANGNITLYLENNATFNNAGTLTAGNGSISYYEYYYGAASTFNNSGTFNVNEPGNTFYLGDAITFNNSGAVNVQAGTLDLQGADGGSTGGSFAVSSGATLIFQNNCTLTAAASVYGAGTVNFNYGTLNVSGPYNVTGNSVFSGATVNFSAPITSVGGLTVSGGTVSFGNNAISTPTLNFSGGSISGTGSLAITGLFSWSGGTLSIPSTTANDGIDIHFGGVYSDSINGGTLTNPSGQNATIGANLILQSGATFNNAGSMTASNGNIDGDFTPTFFNNSGTFYVNEAGKTCVVNGNLTFNNSGAVNVQAGALQLYGSDGGSTSGSFAVSSGAALIFEGNYTLTTAASVSGAGTVDFNGGTVNVNGPYNVTGSTAFGGGNVNFNVPIASLGSGGLTVAGATVNFGSNLISNPLILSGGMITGSSLTISGLFTWSGGTLSVPETTANGGIYLDGNSQVSLTGGTLTNALGQSATVDGTGNVGLSLAKGATFNNAGTLTASNGGINGDRTSTSVNNSGTFNVNEPGGTFPVGVSGGTTFNNSGAVNVQAGTLFLRAAYSGSTGGVLKISPGATLVFDDGFTQIAPVTNNGTVQVEGTGTAGQINGTGSLNIITGSLTLAAGAGISMQSALTIKSNAKLDITNNALEINYGTAADPAATIRGYLQSAYNGGVWTGPGLTSSTVAAQVAATIAAHQGGVYGIGYVDGSVDTNQSANALFKAVGNQIVYGPALIGDANLDGSVTFIDLGIVAQNLGDINSDWEHGDFNYDGTTNFLDIGLLAQNLNFNEVNTPLDEIIPDPSAALTAQWNLAVAEIQANSITQPSDLPEPGMFGLLAAGAGGLLARRRR